MNFSTNLKYLPVYFIFFCGVISHVLLLIAFIKDPLKCFRNSATYLVANLAVADLTISLCGPFVIPGTYVHWSLYIIFRIEITVSFLTIVSIAADRFLMVAFPFKHHSLMNGKKIITWILLIWVLSSSLCARIFFFPGATEYHSSAAATAFDVYVTVILMFITGLLYVLTSLSLRKQARNLALHNSASGSNTQGIRELRERRFLNTILLVACIAVIGIVPFTILVGVLKTKGIHSQRSLAIEILWYFLITLFYSTFAINPLVYFLRLPNYRKTLFALYWIRRSR